MKCGNMQLHQSRKTKRGPAASDDQALGASTHGSSFGNANLMCCRLRCFCSSRFIPKMNMRLQVLHPSFFETARGPATADLAQDSRLNYLSGSLSGRPTIASLFMAS